MRKNIFKQHFRAFSSPSFVDIPFPKQIGNLNDIVQYIILYYPTRFCVIFEKLDPIAPSGKNAMWRFRWDFIDIEKRCNVFSKVYRMHAKISNTGYRSDSTFAPRDSSVRFIRILRAISLLEASSFPAASEGCLWNIQITLALHFGWIAHIMQPWKGFYTDIFRADRSYRGNEYLQ